MKPIILWERDKKAVCEYYECRDKNGNQYPNCRYNPKKLCQLAELQKLLWAINQKRAGN